MSSNGRLTTVSKVQPGITLEPATASAWVAMVAAAGAAGISLSITNGGGYADIAAQRMRAKAGSASSISVAAVGGQTHGWGDRIDVGSFGTKFGIEGARRERWLHEHASEFGFVFEFGNKDPNHLRYIATTTPATTVPIYAEKEMDMKLIKHPNGQHAIAGELIFKLVGAPYTTDSLIPVYGPVIAVSEDSWTFQSQIVAETRAALVTHTAAATNGASVAEITAAIAADLADDFARINANIDDQPTTITGTLS